MNDIETTILLLLLFMSVPDACRKLGRPALAYSAYVLVGILLGPVIQPRVMTMLAQAGQVGFLLLLFEVGLDITLPRFREAVPALRYTLIWVLLQYPLIMALASVAGLGLSHSFFTAAALTGCSVGMAHAAWKHHPFPDEAVRGHVLRIMVFLELLAILLLSVESAVLEKGLSGHVLLKLAGIAATVLLVARFAGRVDALFRAVLTRTTHWRMHLLVLLVLAICALGERLGLSSAKTAFVLGLFMSRIEHDGKGLEEYMAPISQRFLIPIFFVSLGFHVRWDMLPSWNTLLAFGSAGLLLGWREMLHRRYIATGAGNAVCLLFSPNLTIVALAASVLLQHEAPAGDASWLILTGLFLTLGSTLLLPRSRPVVQPVS